MEFECSIVRLTGWPLHSIDETDIESLIPFGFYYPKWLAQNMAPGGAARPKQIYADQATFL